MYPRRPVVRWVASPFMDQHPADVTWSGFYASLDQKWTNPIGKIHRRTVRLPWWVVALSAVLLPGRWLSLRRRRRWEHRLMHGLCLSCGYDLRATQGRCPECGRPASVTSTE